MKPGSSALGWSLALAMTLAWSAQVAAQSVSFTAYPYYVKPYTTNLVTGEVSGTCVDAQDHLFIVTRGFQTGGLASPEGIGGADTKTGTLGGQYRSRASPPVMEFNPNGDVVNGWGNPALVPTGQPNAGQNAVVPNGIHGCYVDFQGNVWIAGTADGVVQKYSHDGAQMLLQIGTKFTCDDGLGGSIPCTGTGGGNVGRTGVSQTLLNQPTDVAVDPGNGDIYIADGGGNHRVVVFNRFGTFLRQMGGVGTGPGQFASAGSGHPNCVVLPNNGMVYACDRGNDRINVYQKDGTFVRAIPVVPGTAALPTNGSASDITFSPDAAQTFMYVADGGNERTWIMNHASALAGQANAILGSFGRPGHAPGELTFVETVATDSKGNVYTGEMTSGRRMQQWLVSQP